MLGLVILFIFGVYLAISIFATRYVMAWARESGRRAWLWGCIAGFAMYSVVFWDLIPTLIVHRYYCSTEAGFWYYKTFEQWEAENPGVRDTLKESLSPDMVYYTQTKRILNESLPQNRQRFWYTQRFYRNTDNTKKVGSIVKVEDEFVDVQTKAIIARSINFVRGLPGNTLAAGGTPSEIRESLVLGWGNRQCVVNGRPAEDTFNSYIYDFWKWGKGK